LKANPALADVPVIFLTALTETEDKVKAFETGGVDYITKPFQLAEVLARVRTHLALREARRALEENLARLRTLEQLRDDLVHMIVHDIRSPLTVVSGSLALVAGDPSLGEESAADVKAAADAARTVTRMANDLLDVSRLEGGKMPLALTDCDVTAAAHDVQAALGTLDRARVIAVHADGPVVVRADAGLVRRLIENIVNNAVKHTPTGGRIDITVTGKPEGVRVAVADQGPGVPPEARQRIFEKFGTVANRQQSAYHSVGLGLTFCKLAVEAHGGSIGVSDGDPSGSVFWFELPPSPPASAS
ncbi:MAG: ATP-binding protein, partial [Vicinamibacterales bacterium]